MVKDRFERHWPADLKTDNAFLLDLLNHRDISNEIAARYQIEHQSPQVLVIKNKQATYVANHNGISADSTVQALS
jgi:bacillithiol system protein YtxJ